MAQITEDTFKSNKVCCKCKKITGLTVKFCPDCGNNVFYKNYDEYLADNAQSCGGQVKFCSDCGTQNDISTNYCVECGSTQFVASKKLYNAKRDSALLQGKENSLGDFEYEFTDYENGYLVWDYKSKIVRYCGKRTDVVIPERKKLGQHVFSSYSKDVKVVSIVIPKEIKMDEGALAACATLENILVKPENTSYRSIDGNLYAGNTLVQYAIGKKDTSFVVPDFVRYIGGYAFDSCGSITDVKLPDSLLTIGDSAFWRCPSLTNITLPDTLTSIGAMAFMGCRSLKSIIIPGSVTSVGDYAFRGCSNLTIYCRAKKPMLGTPKGWGREWNKDKLKVVWDYKL